MKLLRQTTLILEQGQTEKVYEVDLCEVGVDKYVVNFRMGIKGGNTKEGSKTVVPVPLVDAEKIFDKLVSSKQKKGFYDANDPRPTSAPAPTGAASASTTRSALGLAPARKSRFTVDSAAREAAILQRLTKKTKWSLSGKGKAWPISRAVWRAGELRLKSAALPIAALLDDKSADAMLRYSACWALGRIGDSAAAPALQNILGADQGPRHVSRMAAIALFNLADGAQRAHMADAVLGELPSQLAGPARNGPPEDFSFALRRFLDDQVGKAPKIASQETKVLDAISLVDTPITRPALLEILTDLPLRPPFFQRIRHIFKDAEAREDGEIFGLLAFRFEKNAAMFRNNGWSSHSSIDGDWVNTKTELKKGDGSRLAYSSRTRSYLRRRVWRTLRRIGQREDAAAFVKMAVGVLLPFDESDKQSPRLTTSYDYRLNRSVVTHYDSLSGFHALNFILYQNSPRYLLKKGARAWSCQGGFKPGDGAPPVREEAFPELWDQVPAGLLHLLVESGLESVHQFAAKAFRSNSQAMADVPTELVALLLGRPFIVTARLGFELAQKKMENKQSLDDDDVVLVTAACNSVLSDARKEGAKWLQEHRHDFSLRPLAMSKLIRSPFADTRKTMGDLLLGLVLDDQASSLVLEDVLRFFASLDVEEPKERVGDDRGQIIREAGETLLRVFTRQAQRIPLDVVIGLLLHAIDEVQAFAAQVLLAHETRAKDLPADLIPRLLQAKSDRVRNIGMRLFAELDDETLLQKEDLLVQLATSKLEDMRKEVRPIIARLAQRDADFGADLCARLVAFILRKEQVEGLHKDLSELVLGSLASFLSTLTPKTVWRLVHGRSSIAQDLGGHLLKECVEAKDLTVREIAKLASHDILSIREAAWSFYEDNVDRMKAEVADSIILLDAKADDSRSFGFAYFRKHFAQDDLSPAILVAVCDSLRDDVQRFGRDLISRYFQDQDGPEYLLKLSEHPTQDLQLFATNYLERFADGDVDKLMALRHYFLSILSRVNQGSVAKARVLGFLRGQASQSEALAEFVCEVLTRQSLSLVERDRATMIEVLLEIQLRWPKLENPLSLIERVSLETQNVHEAA